MAYEVLPPTDNATASKVRAQMHAQARRRMLNGIPGFISWLILLLLGISVLLIPIIIFNIAVAVTAYAALSMTVAAAAAVAAYRRIRKWERIDWTTDGGEVVRHVILIPSYSEPIPVLQATLRRLAESRIAREQVIVVLAMEESDDLARSTAAKLQREFASAFLHVLTTLHPKGLPDEVKGKSANLAWAARASMVELGELGIALDRVVITVADADSLLHPAYLECVNYKFLTSPRRHETFWQAPVFYHNNIETTSPLFEPMHSYSSALQAAFLGQGLAYSTYSISARLAHKLGWWDVNVIAEDQHMFIKAYVKQQGNLVLDPVYLPISACVVTGASFWQTCVNRFQQTIRHAWGAEEVGYAFDQVLFSEKMPILRGIQLLARVLFDHVVAIAVPVTTFVLLPLMLIAQPEVRQMTPQITLIGVAYVVTILTSMIFWRIDVRLRPPQSRRRPSLLIGLSFFAQPLIMLLLVTLPALIAQTRLLFGSRPLDYQVAPK